MMGASIFVVSGTASGVAGPSAALGFLLAAMIAMIVALCNSEIATAFPETGGAYVYPRRVIPGIPGEMLSFASGWGSFWRSGNRIFHRCADHCRILKLDLKLVWNHTSASYEVDCLCPDHLLCCPQFKQHLRRTYFPAGNDPCLAGIMLLYCILGFHYVNPSNYADFMPNGLPSLFTATAMALMSYGACP